MTLINFEKKTIRHPTTTIIDAVNNIIDDYGITLTFRQIFYVLVKRGEIQNTEEAKKSFRQVMYTATKDDHIDWMKIHWHEPSHPEFHNKVEIWCDNAPFASFIQDQVGHDYAVIGFDRNPTAWQISRARMRLSGQKQFLLFTGLNPASCAVEFEGVKWERVCLTFEQVCGWRLKPNCSHKVDRRHKEYPHEQSWELDSVDPLVMRDNIQALLLGV